jgi:mono/diheme cytochrome c family protein
MFKEYCASCHGADGRGNGPAIGFLKTPPPDLRLMAQRNNGKYPSRHVESILNFGPGTHAHGSLEMPTWGSLFRSLDQSNEIVANGRIYTLSKFIESIQEN